MKKMIYRNLKLNLVFNISLFVILFTGVSFIIQQDKWVAPAATKKLKNTTDPNDADGIFTAKALYMKNCKSCHGKIGKGDGSKAKELKTPCGDLTSSEVQSQFDGELFYKIKEGRQDMPAFKDVITQDEDIWLVVNYVRTLNGK